jgi:hypothetical protein
VNFKGLYLFFFIDLTELEEEKVMQDGMEQARSK